MIINFESKTLKFSISGFRGYYPEDINPGNIPKITQAYAKSLPKGAIAVARDSRPTGESIEYLTIGGLIAMGRKVYSLGIVPTPTIKAFIKEKKLAGGLMISASHNAMRYNAYKFIKKDGLFFDAADNKKFQKHLEDLEQTWPAYNKQGNVEENTSALARQTHIESILETIAVSKGRKLKVAIDTCGACATDIVPELLKRLKVDFVSVNSEYSDRFPREPEPVPKALKVLQKLVIDEKCDIGFAFDPDADRLALVDDQGNAIGEEYTLPLSLLVALKRRKGNVVINLSSSHLTDYVAQKFGRKVFRSKVGEANVVALMKKKKITLGGEGNGGVIDLKIPSLGRDSLTGVAYSIALLRENPKKSLSQIIEGLEKTHMVKIALDLDTSLEELYAEAEAAFGHFEKSTLDGLRLNDKSGLPWIHLRPSNTEPIVRLIVEGKNSKEVGSILKTLNPS